MTSSKSMPKVTNKTHLGLEIRSNINIDTQRYMVIRIHLPDGVTFVNANEASVDDELIMPTYNHQQERPAHELTERYLCTGRAILYIDNNFEQIKLVCLKSTYKDCPHHERCCRKIFTDGNSYILKSREIDIFVSEMTSIRYGSENSCTPRPKYSDSIRGCPMAEVHDSKKRIIAEKPVLIRRSRHYDPERRRPTAGGSMAEVHDVDDARQITEYVTSESFTCQYRTEQYNCIFLSPTHEC